MPVQCAVRVSERGRQLIREAESLQLKAYLCPTGHWSIGYGHAKGVKPGMVISEDQAEALLLGDLAEIADTLRSHFCLNQNQFDAVASFVYNLGWGKFRVSPMYRRLAKGEYELFASKLLEYNKGVVNGKLVALGGLTKRRQAEKALFEDLSGLPVAEIPRLG